MPPSPTVRTSDHNSADATSYSTASHTITANKLILLTLTTASAANGNAPTSISGHGATWVLVASRTEGSFTSEFLYRTMVGSDSTGTITITYADTQTQQTWSVVEWANVDTSGSQGSGAIVQSATAGQATSTDTLTVTLAAFASSDNRPFAAFGTNLNSGTATPETGWTELLEISGAESSATAMWRDDTADTSATVTWSATDPRHTGIAVEIKAAAVSG